MNVSIYKFWFAFPQLWSNFSNNWDGSVNTTFQNLTIKTNFVSNTRLLAFLGHRCNFTIHKLLSCQFIPIFNNNAYNLKIQWPNKREEQTRCQSLHNNYSSSSAKCTWNINNIVLYRLDVYCDNVSIWYYDIIWINKFKLKAVTCYSWVMFILI